jgi:type IV secretory pathway TraG/TraD family ATPase VirD4
MTYKEHGTVVGRSRVGKTVITKRIMRQFLSIKELLPEEIKPKKKIVMNDVKGDMIEEFWTEKDWVILNPFDSRGYGIDIFDLIPDETKIALVTNAIFVENEESKSDPIWINSARSTFEAIINLCLQKGETDNLSILKYAKMSAKQLAKEFSIITTNEEGKRVRVARPGCERAYNNMVASQAENLLSNFNSYTEVFYALASSKKVLKIRDYIHEDKRNLIMANFSTIKDKIAPIFSLFFNMLSDFIMDSPEDPDRDFLLVLDEFASLLKIDRMSDMLQKGSGLGISVWILLQEFKPISQIYGDGLALSFINNSANKFFFQISDDETRAKIQKLIGTQTVTEITENVSVGDTDAKDGVSFNKQKKEVNALRNDVVLSSLDKHNFYYMQSGLGERKNGKAFSYVARITGFIDEEVDFRDKIAIRFVAREDLEITAYTKKMLDEINKLSNEENPAQLMVNAETKTESSKQSDAELVASLKAKLAKKKENTGASTTNETVVEVNNTNSPFV